MRHEEAYRARCAARGLDEAAVARAVAVVEGLESRLGGGGRGYPLEEVEAHLAGLRASGGREGGATGARGAAGARSAAAVGAPGGGIEEALMALARYFVVAGEEALAIRLLAYLLPIGVLPAMLERLGRLEGEEVRARVGAAFSPPPPGSPPEVYPEATAAFVRALREELGPERAARVLRWNVHGVPAAAHAAEREAYLAAPSLEAWLAERHARQVAVLERHAAEGKLWFEQRITPRVVDFVRGNQEILSAVREGDRLFVTKIPYDPDRWLTCRDPVERRRLACHCPLAASTIGAEDRVGSGGTAAAGAALAGTAEAGAGGGSPRRPLDPLWCECSAGYEKFLFDVAFGLAEGEGTEARVLKSALSGAELCRYEILLPASVLDREARQGGPRA